MFIRRNSVRRNGEVSRAIRPHYKLIASEQGEGLSEIQIKDEQGHFGALCFPGASLPQL